MLEEDQTTIQRVWLPQLRKAMAAFFDLDSVTLWLSSLVRREAYQRSSSVGAYGLYAPALVFLGALFSE